MQSCLQSISADLPPAPPVFKCKINNTTWAANSTINAIVHDDTLSDCGSIVISGLKVGDANDPSTFETLSLTINNFNVFSTGDLCIPVGNYFEVNNAANPNIGCTTGGGRVFSSALYTKGASVFSNGSNICTVKITACKNNSISGTFSFKAIDNNVVPAKTYNITGGAFTDIPLVKI